MLLSNYISIHTNTYCNECVHVSNANINEDDDDNNSFAMEIN